jgi:predicted porin
MAQSSLTMFGIVDVGVQGGQGSVSNRLQIGSGGNMTSRLGLRGIEDLGGGVAASFWLEAGFNADDGSFQASNADNQGRFTAVSGKIVPSAVGNGSLTFNRRSTLGITGPFGEIRLGRDYTPQFWNQTLFDPFGGVGVGTSQPYSASIGGPIFSRASNSIGYFLPAALGGFYGQVQYYFGENPSNVAAPIDRGDGSGGGVRLGYAKGPFNAALAYAETRYAVPGNIRTINFGGSYDLRVATLRLIYNQDKVEGAGQGRGYMLAVTAPAGPGEFKVSYSAYKVRLASGSPNTGKLALGYVYNLSKRSVLYATLARATNRDGAATGLNGSMTAINANSTGYDVGLRHSF